MNLKKKHALEYTIICNFCDKIPILSGKEKSSISTSVGHSPTGHFPLDIFRFLGAVVSYSFVRWQHNRGRNCVSIALTNLLFVIIVVYTGSRKKLRMADL